MEGCEAYEPWHDKQTGKTFVRCITGKCLHYYFYFVDESLGLCYLRADTNCHAFLKVRGNVIANERSVRVKKSSGLRGGCFGINRLAATGASRL
jgi:hypothetical protein